MPNPVRSIHEINDLAVRVLVREMGPADAARFINQFSVGNGNYTEERKEQFKDLTVEDIIRQLQDRTRMGS